MPSDDAECVVCGYSPAPASELVADDGSWVRVHKSCRVEAGLKAYKSSRVPADRTDD
jgi:hypothetical protein